MACASFLTVGGVPRHLRPCRGSEAAKTVENIPATRRRGQTWDTQIGSPDRFMDSIQKATKFLALSQSGGELQ